MTKPGYTPNQREYNLIRTKVKEGDGASWRSAAARHRGQAQEGLRGYILTAQ
jgi:hypothetical protein